MEDWETVKLGDVIELDTGYPFKSKNFTENEEDIPLVKGSNLQQGYIDWDEAKKWPKEEFEDFKDYELKEGDVVLAMDRPWVSAGLKYSWITSNDPRSLLVQRIARLRSNGKLRQDYLRYLIASRGFTDYIKPIVTGVNVPHISPDQIKSFEFNLPPLSIQKEVASILSPFDELIENNTRRIEILEEMARRIYREWFVHFRYPGHEEDELVDSGTELGEIPEGWDAINLGNVLTKLESGKRPKGGVSQYKEGVPSVGAENVLGVGQYTYSKEKYVPEEFYEEMNKGIVEDYDVLIYKDGASLGRVSIFGDGFPHRELCINSHAYLVRTDNTCSQAYLYFWMDSPMIKSTIRNSNTNAAQPGINMGDVRGFPFLIPSDKILEKFDEIGVPIVSQIFHLAKKNQRLKETRYLLLSKLISGEINVNKAKEVR